MISVCIATHNGENFIQAQLESIVNQLSENDEIIISDDGSEDNTINIIKSFGDPRIKLFFHLQKNKKTNFKFDLVTRNFENALLHAKGDFLFLSDQDDVWLPEKIHKMLPLLNSNDLVISDCIITDSNLNQIKDSYLKYNFRSGVIANIYKSSFLGCCMGFRREVLKLILPFPKSPIPHDLWIGLMIKIYGKTHYLKETLMLFRRHNNNVTFSGQKNNNSIFFRLNYRIIIIVSLIKTMIKVQFNSIFYSR